MNFRLQFNMDNAAFMDADEELETQEIVRILAHAARQVESGATDATIHDANGNTVGYWVVEGND